MITLKEGQEIYDDKFLPLIKETINEIEEAKRNLPKDCIDEIDKTFIPYIIDKLIPNFNSDEYNIKGNSIYLKNWPPALHYEIFPSDKNIGVEIHIASDQLTDLAEKVNSFEQKLSPLFPQATDESGS